MCSPTPVILTHISQLDLQRENLAQSGHIVQRPTDSGSISVTSDVHLGYLPPSPTDFILFKLEIYSFFTFSYLVQGSQFPIS